MRDGVPVGLGCGARGWWWDLVAVPVGGGRARAGLEIDHSEPSGSRVAISRAAGASGAWNTRGATSSTINGAGRRPRARKAARPDTTRGARNTRGATQQLKPQKHNEKYPLKHQHSQLHSNTPKSHMRNMRAS